MTPRLLSIFLISFSGGFATQSGASSANPAYASVRDNAALPRVLLLGDSISIGYTLPVRELLRGIATVHRPAASCGSTAKALENIDKWLGDGRWDVIHFNFGIEDAKDGVSLRQYQANLKRLVRRMKRTGTQLIWASTTPIPNGLLLRLRNPKTALSLSDKVIREYNIAACRIAQENQIAINDLYAFALPLLSDLQKPNDFEFTVEGSERLAEQVAATVCKALGRSGREPR